MAASCCFSLRNAWRLVCGTCPALLCVGQSSYRMGIQLLPHSTLLSSALRPDPFCGGVVTWSRCRCCGWHQSSGTTLGKQRVPCLRLDGGPVVKISIKHCASQASSAGLLLTAAFCIEPKLPLSHTLHSCSRQQPPAPIRHSPCAVAQPLSAATPAGSACWLGLQVQPLRSCRVEAAGVGVMGFCCM